MKRSSLPPKPAPRNPRDLARRTLARGPISAHVPYLTMFRRRGGYRRLSVTSAVANANANANANEAYRENPRADRSRYASEISSSLPLQILLYYNGLFSAAYFVLMGGLIIEKVRAVTI